MTKRSLGISVVFLSLLFCGRFALGQVQVRAEANSISVSVNEPAPETEDFEGH